MEQEQERELEREQEREQEQEQERELEREQEREQEQEQEPELERELELGMELELEQMTKHQKLTPEEEAEVYARRINSPFPVGVVRDYLAGHAAGVASCQERIKELEEALDFYACEFNWHSDTDCQEFDCCERDKGKRAKAALEGKPKQGQTICAHANPDPLTCKECNK